jgi:hypothetical protein
MIREKALVRGLVVTFTLATTGVAVADETPRPSNGSSAPAATEGSNITSRKAPTAPAGSPPGQSTHNYGAGSAGRGSGTQPSPGNRRHVAGTGAGGQAGSSGDAKDETGTTPVRGAPPPTSGGGGRGAPR